MTRPSRFRLLFVVLAFVVLPSCDSGPPPIESVSISGGTITFTFVGENRTLTVSIVDTDGMPRTDVAVTWISTNPAVADVSAAGLVTARGSGTTSISATAGGVESTPIVVSVDQRAAEVAVAETQVSFNTLGETAVLTATATDQGGTPVTTASFSWTSTRPSVATVSPAGVVTAVGEGTATIRASSDGVPSNAVTVSVDQIAVTVQIDPLGPLTMGFIGELINLTAQAFDGGGSPIVNPDADWTSSDTGVATVSASGVLRSVAEGQTFITARVDAVASELLQVDVDLNIEVLVNGQRRTDLAAPTGQQRFFSFVLPAGVGELHVGAGGGTGDLDLFLKRGETPTNDFQAGDQFASGRTANDENIEVLNPQAGEWFILLDAFAAYSGASLTLRWSTEAPTFDIQLEFVSQMTASQQNIVRQAADRWEQILPTDLFSLWITSESDQCAGVAVTDYVDDLHILVGVSDIDDADGTLAQASPCFVRTGGDPPSPPLPILGFLAFDLADLDALEASGQLFSTALHEIGHVLGVGTIWIITDPPLVEDRVQDGGTDPIYVGPLGTQAFDDVGGTSYQGRKVPVENTGGEGTQDGHWRESVFDGELMTGFNEGGGQNEPLSIVTLQSLADIGFDVLLNLADPYQLPAGQGAGAAAARREGGAQLVDDILWLDLFGIDRDGKVQLLRRGRR